MASVFSLKAYGKCPQSKSVHSGANGHGTTPDGGQQHAWFIIVAPSDLLNIDWMIGSTSVADHARAKLEMSSITSSSPRAQLLRRAEHLGHHSGDQIHDSSQHHL